MRHNISPKDNLEAAVKAIENEIRQTELATYSPTVLSEAQNPSNFGRTADADAYAVHNGPCGDRMEIFLVVRNGRIDRITYTTTGCGASIATGSMLTKMAVGRTVEDAKAITAEELIDALNGLPEEHTHCAHLAIKTLRLAIAELETTHKTKNGQGKTNRNRITR